MKDFIFYKDTIIGKEIAFIFDIKFRYVNKITKSNVSNNMLIVLNEEEEKSAIKEKIIHKENYLTINDLCDYLDNFNRDYEKSFRRNQAPKRKIEEIFLIPNEMLYLSEMFLKVLFSKPKDIDCEELINKVNLDFNGYLWGCCPGWISKPYGNFLTDDNVYDNYYARIIKLSQINKTYCFCNLKNCKYYDRKHLNNFKPKLKVREYPEQFTVSIDRTCNLRCNSCRKKFYIPSKSDKEILDMITDRLIESDILNHTDVLLAGQGEVFYSDAYDKILKSLKPAETIRIMTNGTLFTKDKWELIYPKFKIIHIAVSIDAAHKETYTKLRHGNFDDLMKNLDMLGRLKRRGKIDKLWFNYVV